MVAEAVNMRGMWSERGLLVHRQWNLVPEAPTEDSRVWWEVLRSLPYLLRLAESIEVS